MMWAPDANQGPLLGIFITGPLGTAAGAIGGGVRPKQAADFFQRRSE